MLSSTTSAQHPKRRLWCKKQTVFGWRLKATRSAAVFGGEGGRDWKWEPVELLVWRGSPRHFAKRRRGGNGKTGMLQYSRRLRERESGWWDIWNDQTLYFTVLCRNCTVLYQRSNNNIHFKLSFFSYSNNDFRASIDVFLAASSSIIEPSERAGGNVKTGLWIKCRAGIGNEVKQHLFDS